MEGVVLELGDVGLLGYIEWSDGVASKDIRLESNQTFQVRQNCGRRVEAEAQQPGLLVVADAALVLELRLEAVGQLTDADVLDCSHNAPAADDLRSAAADEGGEGLRGGVRLRVHHHLVKGHGIIFWAVFGEEGCVSGISSVEFVGGRVIVGSVFGLCGFVELDVGVSTGGQPDRDCEDKLNV